MRLTQIKLAGFKSFPEPVTIDLPGDIVAVVGPNGCGKSNLIDALRWVLGESSPRQLRGESMQDVIFNGTGTRPALARAAVELKFDNQDGDLPGPWGQYGEISVKRLLTRQGEGSYWLNGQEVRRKDITELFLGAGLGAGGYAVIEQGMVAKIIDAKPEELRTYIDEAAGIAQYKHRRRETEQKLARTRENLERVRDLQNELAARVKELKAQAAAAEDYLAVKGDLAGLQQRLKALEVKTATEKIAALQQQKAAAAATEAELKVTLSSRKNSHAAIETAEYALQDELKAASSAAGNLQQELAVATAAVKFRREADAARRQAAQSRAVAAARLRSEISKTERQLSVYTDELQLTRQLLQAAALTRQKNQTASLDNKKLRQAQEVLAAKLQTSLNQDVQNIRLNTQKTEGLQRQARIDIARAEELKRQLTAKTLIMLPPLQQQQQHCRQILEKLRESLAHKESALARNSAALTAKKTALSLIRQELVKSSTEINLRQEQQQLSEHSHDDFWGDCPPVKKTSLWEVMTVDPEWEEAAAGYLGIKLYAAVAAGFKLDGTAKLGSGGWINKLPLSAPVENKVADALISKIKVNSPQWQELVIYWLGHVRCIDSLAAAIERQGELKGHECWLTPAGGYVDAVSVIVPAGHNGEPLIFNLKVELAKLRDSRKLQQQQEQKLLTVIAELEAENSVLNRELQTEKAALAAAQNQLAKAAAELTAAADKNDLYAERQREITAELKTLRARSATAEQAMHTADSDITAAGQEVKIKQSALQEVKVKVRQLRAAEQESERLNRQAGAEENKLTIKLLDLENKINTAKNKHSDCINALAAAQKEEDADLAAAAKDNAGADRKITELSGLWQAKSRDAEQLTRKLQKLRADKIKIKEEIEELNLAVVETGQMLYNAEVRLNRENIYQEQALNALGTDRHNLEGLWALNEQHQDRVAALSTAIEKLTLKADTLGRVNLMAPEELQNTAARYEFYAGQSADIAASAELLATAIAQIDHETGVLFQQTLLQVNQQLQRFFPLLLGGGEAYLSAVAADLLTTGIDFTVIPAGKKKQTIQLLSGGEKALTALSLVFALFKLKPAPFCLLDEVDAPLDDANTQRLCRIFTELASLTQFIFISHNKITMAAAEQLIGVTMQEKGVSKIIGITFNELSPTAGQEAAEL